jgi:hypothetical protein
MVVLFALAALMLAGWAAYTRSTRRLSGVEIQRPEGIRQRLLAMAEDPPYRFRKTRRLGDFA